MRQRAHNPTIGRTLTAGYLAILLSVLVSIIVGGCSDATGPETRLSSESFERQGNLICTELGTQIEEILQDRSDEFGRPTPEAYQLISEARANSFEALFALRPPVESEADLAQLQAVREEWTATLNARVPEPDLDLRLGPQMDEAFMQLNLHDCI